jgi:hypothetical protein
VLPTRTVVSYRVTQVGDEFRLIRVECYSVNGGAATCNSRTVLRDLDPPPGGFTWVPGVTAPSWLITVSQAGAADDTTDASGTVEVDPGLKNKNAQRVVVSINGGGDAAGAGGGQARISLSAGGTNRETNLATDELTGAPSFTAARSRCGGNFGLIVDTSGSIGSDMGSLQWNGTYSGVIGGVRNFIDQFAGTPVKLQVVTFSTTSTTLGASGWTRYYDMLNDADVTDLKNKVAGMRANGGTNWEDGFFRMLRNSDGTVQAQLPNTILFFTDGIPTYDRLNATSASVAATADPADGNLPASNGSDYSQRAWNRTERLIRDRGSINLIGVYVNDSTSATSQWTVAGSGYHIDYQRADAVVYEKGTTTYERGNTVVYQRGYHQYERNSNVSYQYATSGIVWERKWGSNWISARSGYSSSSSQARSSYFNNNSTPDESDGYRARVTGSLGGWTTFSDSSDYDASNSVAGSSDGFQAVGSTSGSWVGIDQSVYDLNNTTSNSNDGFRTGTYYSSPYLLWTSSGVSQSTYDSNNSSSSESDGWRTTTTGTPSSWTAVTAAQYNASNTTSNESDGWRTSTTWATTTQPLYDAGNTTTDASDLWRTRVNGSIGSWTNVTQAQYNASNTTSDGTDGWQTVKNYTLPYDAFDPSTYQSIKNYATIGNLVVDNTSGEEGGFVEALPRGGPYTNAAAADLFVLPNYTNFGTALASVALGQCGGTVTLQTKVGSSAAQDPFTYENVDTHETVQTSAAYRSGTFDIALPGGGSTTVTIGPQDFTNLTNYRPAGWTCKSAGVAYPFTTDAIAGHAPWTSITLTVNPNQAVSCVQQVTFA